MAEYKLSYTASEIDERLAKVETIERQQKELDGKVTICTFNITKENQTVTFRDLINVTEIDWGDGTITPASDIPNTVDKLVQHTYSNIGEYICKIYDATTIKTGEDDLTGERALTKVMCADIVDDCRFSYNHELTHIKFPNNITTIPDNVAIMCDKLMTIEIPNSVTTIGSYAFYNCDSLTSVVIGDSVTSIGSSAFYECTSLTSVVIPNSVTSIGSSAFDSCTSLTSVEIGNGVKIIGTSAFYNCTSLTSVVIGDGVTTIGKEAFRNCTSLTSIEIPDSVTAINDIAFLSCSNLRKVIFKRATPITYNSAMFPKDVKLFLVPHDSLETYKTTTGWSTIKDKINSIAYVSDVGDAIDITSVTTNQIPAYIDEKLQNSGLKSYEHLESEKVFRVRTNPNTNINQSITITDEAIYNSKNSGDTNGTFSLAHSGLHVENSAFKTDYAPWGIKFGDNAINFPNLTKNEVFATTSNIGAAADTINERITTINNELSTAINNKPNYNDLADLAADFIMPGWTLENVTFNRPFILKDGDGEDANILYEGFSTIIRYVNSDVPDRHVVVADVYVTTGETMAQQALTIPSGLMGNTTIGYKWENAYFPLQIACPNELIGEDFLNFKRRDVVEYSWIRDSDNLENTAGWMDGSGSISAHITNQKHKEGDVLTNILSYVQGRAVALSSNCNFSIPITGQHFVVKMYDFFK